MKKFLVTYLAPSSVIDEWKKTEPEQRKQSEEKMQSEWKKWMGDHKKMFADKGAGVGKTKRVTKEGTADTKNDLMRLRRTSAGAISRCRWSASPR